MNYTPVNDYIIVKKLESSKTTVSGIILTSTTGADNAEVIAVNNKEDTIVVGNTVMIRWSNALKVDGNIYAVSSKEVVCILS